jgi:peptide subunit release factor 1 (eRF1)
VRTAQLLLERLPHKPDLIIEQLAGSRSADGSQSDRPAQLSAALRRSAAMQNAVLLERIHTHLGPDGLAVEGSRDTINALAAGRVATLVVSDDPNDARTAWFGHEPTELFASQAEARRSRTLFSEGALVDVAVRAALLTGARVRMIPTGAAGLPAGGIGALCRYRLTQRTPETA